MCNNYFFGILAGFQKDCIVCMVSDTFILSQKHTGSSFKASIITSRLSCKYMLFINIYT